MDIKWKNISRCIIMWAAVAAILVSSYFGVEAMFDIADAARNMQQAGSYYEADPNDLFEDRDFEDSSSYKRYLANITWHYVNAYRDTGKLEIEDKESFTGKDLKELNVSFTGTVSYQNKKKKEDAVIRGTKIDEKEENDENIVYVQIIPQKEDNRCTIQTIIRPSKEEEAYIDQTQEYYEAYVDQSYQESGNKQYEDDEFYQIKEIHFFMKIPEQNYDQLKQAWNMWMNEGNAGIHDLILYGCIILISVLAIILTASPKISAEWEKKFDRMWLEILLFFLFWLVMGACACGVGYAYVWSEGWNDQFAVLAMAGILICEFLALYGCISIVRKIKAGYFIRSSICYKVLYNSYRILKNQQEEWKIWSRKRSSTLTAKEKALRRKRIGLLFILAAEVFLVFAVCSMFGFFPIGIFVLIWMGILFRRLFEDYKKDVQDLLDLEKVLWQIYEISEGNLDAKTDIGEDSLYYKASESLCHIGSGMAKSVEEQTKSQRMKVDLITNVSHDLKTPLTSIISYIDLLSKDSSLSEEAKDYVRILEKKAERLKNIVIDLFDLAKTTSGNVKADLSILDMRKLVEQTMVEMEDKIEASGFEIIAEYEVETAQFKGDANRMYRVVQNILDNALKYSLKGSRIYVKVTDDGQNWKLSVINTAAYRMQFTEEEILERFTRGDQSRTTEGSGLGLSIADSFTKLCGGDLHIAIHGDQFCVEVTFLKY